MSVIEESSGNSVSVMTLAFPPEVQSFDMKRKCALREVFHNKLNPVTSVEMGVPPIMSIRKAKTKLSPLPSTTRSTPSIKVIPTKCPSSNLSRKPTCTMQGKPGQDKRSKFLPPCPDSVLLGVPKSFIGKCPLTNLTSKQISNKNKFTLTEDPRKIFCLRNPQILHFKPTPLKKELSNVRELVKTADNLVTPSESQSSISSICEVVDLANPLNLDFQGMDYKNTYQQDEQAYENQMEYRKVRRYKNRRNVKVQTRIDTKKDQQNERISIPKHFSLDDTAPVEHKKGDLPKEKQFLKVAGKLVRAEQKPGVRQRLQQEDLKRKQRYKKLYLRMEKKIAENEKLEESRQRETTENFSTKLAEQDIKDLIDLLDRTITTKTKPPRQIPKKKEFPHNIKEALKLRHQLKKSNRIIQDRAKIKKEFYQQLGKPKIIREADLEISADSQSPSVRKEEESSNDEDDMQVGKQGSKILLRGFLYKMSSNLRGKFHQKELASGERKVKGCMTRNEWFETLVSRKRQADSAQKHNTVMSLFPRILGLKPLVTSSPIKQFRAKPLGRHYDTVIRRNLRIKKPKQIKVRKFNLINYLYGIEAKEKKEKIFQSAGNSQEQNIESAKTLKYMQNRSTMEKLKKRLQKRRRMHFLGIPCVQRERKQAKQSCLDSDSGESDWVPDDASVKELPIERLDLRARGNMPAPEFREPTLRRHPRHPRHYEKLRVASAVFDDFVCNQNIPIMEKLDEDTQVAENVRRIENNQFANKFEIRHHHDHWNPTQHKSVTIKYSKKLAKPQAFKNQSKQIETKRFVKSFDKARPRGEGCVDADFTMPKSNKQAKERTDASSVKGKPKTKHNPNEIQIPNEFHSLAKDEFQEFPGRDKFLKFISEIKQELAKRTGFRSSELDTDKRIYLSELQEDLRSIESCLSSLSSSECSNLTNDSGSFLMAGDKKIPLDYIRKSLVPFEEMNRSRFEAVVIDPAKEERNPYRMVPFSGQQKEQLNMTAPKDGFFTFNTRIQNGLRLRLEVKQDDRRKQLLGTRGTTKAPAQVATDIDELYIQDLHNRSAFKPFKWNSCRTMIKDALRKKFESMLIQGEIVRTKIYDRKNEKYFQEMAQMKGTFENLFSKWEKKEYETATAVVHKVKPYYEATDRYRHEFHTLQSDLSVINLEIVYTENDWMRRTILQNFHYLLADMEWRVDHDWIHQKNNGELESFGESIAKRSTTNIRKRDKDDAWAIKDYYFNVYLHNYHPLVVVFESKEQFMNGIENLKSKTFVLLLELHYTLWILSELEQQSQELNDWCIVELESKKTYAKNKNVNRYYMELRAEKLKSQVHTFLDRPLHRTFNDVHLGQIKGICNEMYKDVCPTSTQLEIDTVKQVAAISQVLTTLIGKFEDIDADRRENKEKKYRRMLDYRRMQSKQAVLIERRIASEMVKVRQNLAPPFQKSLRVGKLPRSEIQKTTKVHVAKSVKISQKTKFFYNAFHEGDLVGLKEVRCSLDIMENIQESIIPFYFDHFLSINGYQPNYNFKTQIEQNDGPEIDRFQVKHLIPEIMEKFNNWQNMKKMIMEENISKNPQMYQNVQI